MKSLLPIKWQEGSVETLHGVSTILNMRLSIFKNQTINLRPLASKKVKPKVNPIHHNQHLPLPSQCKRNKKGLTCMIKGIVFDLDGTLLNTLEDLKDCCNAALEKYGLPTHELDEYRYFVGMGIRKLIENAISVPTEKETVDQVYEDFNRRYKDNCMNKTAPYPGILEMLDQLKKMDVKMGLVSNKAHAFTLEIVDIMFPGKYFDVVFGKMEGVPAKPDATAVLKQLEMMKLTREETVYIGDSNIDVLTARNSSLRCIGVTWGFRDEAELVEYGADFIARTPEDIVRIIREN